MFYREKSCSHELPLIQLSDRRLRLIYLSIGCPRNYFSEEPTTIKVYFFIVSMDALARRQLAQKELQHISTHHLLDLILRKSQIKKILG